MRERAFIFIGLALFVGLFTYPFWQGLGAKADTAMPPVQPAAGQQCVAAGEFMRRSHMQLLSHWRDDVVRSQQRDVGTAAGQVVHMSLDKTCMGACHAGQSGFCERCHTYVAAPALYCWDCHQGAVEARNSQ